VILTHYCGTFQAAGADKNSTQTGDEAIRNAEIWRSLMRTIQDQEMVLNQNGFRDNGTSAAWTRESANGDNDMEEEDKKIAHSGILQNAG
jgi:hypothetical protein